MHQIFVNLKRRLSHQHGPFMLTNCLNYGPQLSCCRAHAFHPDPVNVFPSFSFGCYTLPRRGSHFCGRPPCWRLLHIQSAPFVPSVYEHALSSLCICASSTVPVPSTSEPPNFAYFKNKTCFTLSLCIATGQNSDDCLDKAPITRK